MKFNFYKDAVDKRLCNLSEDFSLTFVERSWSKTEGISFYLIVVKGSGESLFPVGL